MEAVIPVVWLDSHITCWDQAMVDAALSDRLWPVGYEFAHQVGFDGVNGGAVVVVPARHHVEDIDRINDALAALDWCLVVLTSDEERVFPADKLDHPRMRVWTQTPRVDDVADVFLPVGWPPQLPVELATFDYAKPARWFFSGQVNNVRRLACVEALREMDGGALVETPGFTQGLSHKAYAAALARARFAPCPAGPVTVDTFRVCEALEAGCVPILDTRTVDDQAWYWPMVGLGGLPTVRDWSELPGLLDELESSWPANANRLSARWQATKRSLCMSLGSAIRDLSGVSPAVGEVTVLIPTSPVASHPDTGIVEETVASVRHWLPDAEILVMCDGVRPEQEDYRARYEDYLQRLLWLCGTKWRRVLPVVHDEHLHQAEMTRRALDLVHTPLVLFVEHDTPLVVDEPIDWPALMAAALSGEADVIRLHHEALVLPDHEHLMLDQKPRDARGAPLLRTVQWSQRPHLANTSLYRRILTEHFPAGYRGMIEDVMHGAVHSGWREHGLAGWDRYRLHMYAPPGNIKRSYHLDARAGDTQWVDS